MKEIILNSKKHGQKIVLVDDEDFEYINQFRWFVNKYANTFYAIRNIKLYDGKKTTIFMHRVISGSTIIHGEICDHRDRNGLNNQKENLRSATYSQNNANSISKKNSSKYLGVCWDNRNRRWRAQITKDTVNKYLGNFKSEEDAALAYNKKATELHGEFANLNKVG